VCRADNLPLLCADCLEIWEPQPPGTLWGSPGLSWDGFTSILQSSLIPGHFVWDYGGKNGILMHFSLSTSVFFLSVLPVPQIAGAHNWRLVEVFGQGVGGGVKEVCISGSVRLF